MHIKQIFKENKITYPLYIAKNGLEALAMLRSQDGKPPVIPKESRLVLLALNLPQINGREFLSELRSDPELKAIPVVILTNCDEEQEKLETYKLNVAGYICKPIASLELAEVIVTIVKYWTINEML